jgi:hypothetical protein
MSRELDELAPFVGRWRMTPSFLEPDRNAPNAQTSFEWLPGKRFVIQRWEVEHPDAPDGIAIIGFDDARDRYLQHYFDSRGVVREYEMGFDDNVWTLQRIADEPDFSQRFSGRFSDDGATINGSWQGSHDRGSTWAADFDLTYTRID